MEWTTKLEKAFERLISATDGSSPMEGDARKVWTDRIDAYRAKLTSNRNFLKGYENEILNIRKAELEALSAEVAAMIARTDEQERVESERAVSLLAALPE